MKKLNLFMGFLFLTTTLSYSQNVGINTTGTAPDAGAGLDINFTDKGALVPRVNIADLNTIAPITGSATTSLLVFNTNTLTGVGYYYWNGAQWVKFSTAADAWQVDGNTGLNAANNFLGTTDNVAVRIRTNNTNRFEFTTNGRLRSFNTGSAGAPTYSWQGDANTGMYRIGADILGFSTNGVERMRFIANGQSSINGIPTAGDVFSVYAADATLAWGINSYNTGVDGGSGFFLNSNAANGFNALEVISTSSLNFNGWFWRNNNTNNIPAMRATTDAGNNRWGIYTDDEVLALNYFVTSDERLKKNIQNVSSVLDNIKLLRPVQYEFNNLEYPSFGTEDVLQFGFLAAELAEIFPNTVAENSVYDPNELPNESKQSMEGITPKFSSVNYIALVPILTKGIQEQQAIIEVQNERIDALEQLVFELQKTIENK